MNSPAPIHCFHLALLLVATAANAQISNNPQHPDARPESQAEPAVVLNDAKSELKAGSDLTRRGYLQDAIGHLLTAQKAGADRFATGVNLAICYLGLRRYRPAIDTLEGLRASGYKSATVYNLLSQAYLGTKQKSEAMIAFAEAAALTPEDEKLYAYLADACTDHREYGVGLQVVEKGLQSLPASARLHYERALFLARLSRLEEARPEFARAAALAPGSYVATLAQVQADLYDEKFAEATDLLRKSIHEGHHDYQSLSLFGTVLLQAGAAPGDPEFAEAKSALEESEKERADYSATQIALGKIAIMEKRFDAAVDHLEHARRLEPENPAAYTNLAQAYRRLGNAEKARQIEATLAEQLSQSPASTR